MPWIAQLVKNLPAMQETPIWFLDWEGPLGKGTGTHSSILAMDCIVHGVAKSWTWLSDFHLLGFPDSSVGKESDCNAGNPGLIHGSGRWAGEEIDYPLQYSWASLVAELVKNPPAMRETWVWSLGWEDPLEKGKATHSSILAWRIPWTIQSMGSQRVWHDWVTFTFFV